MEDLKYFIRDSVFFFFFCKTQNRVIVPGEIYIKAVYRKDPRVFGQIVCTNSANGDQSAPIRIYTVAIPSVHSSRLAMTG